MNPLAARVYILRVSVVSCLTSEVSFEPGFSFSRGWALHTEYRTRSLQRRSADVGPRVCLRVVGVRSRLSAHRVEWVPKLTQEAAEEEESRRRAVLAPLPLPQPGSPLNPEPPAALEVPGVVRQDRSLPQQA